jgi:hypothetical protein
VARPEKKQSDPNQLLAAVQKRLEETGSHLSITRCTRSFVKVAIANEIWNKKDL